MQHQLFVCSSCTDAIGLDDLEEPRLVHRPKSRWRRACCDRSNRASWMDMQVHALRGYVGSRKTAHRSTLALRDPRRMLFCCHMQGQPSINLNNEALNKGPKSGATFAGPFRPPIMCPPTVGGHRLGGAFLIQIWHPFWGRSFVGSKRGSVSWSQQFNTSLVFRCQRLLCLSVAT